MARNSPEERSNRERLRSIRGANTHTHITQYSTQSPSTKITAIRWTTRMSSGWCDVSAQRSLRSERKMKFKQGSSAVHRTLVVVAERTLSSRARTRTQQTHTCTHAHAHTETEATAALSRRFGSARSRMEPISSHCVADVS